MEWVNDLMVQCIWNDTFGMECPGCGFQRSVAMVIEGDIMSGIKMFPALVPLITLMSMLLVHLKFKLKYGARILVFLFGLTMAIMIGNYLLKLVVLAHG